MRILVASLVALLAGCAGSVAASDENRLDQLVRQFSAVAFDSELGSRRNRFLRVEDVAVIIRVLEPSYGHRSRIAATLDELRGLTGLEVRLLDTGDMTTPANVIMRFNRNNVCRLDGEDPNEPARIQISVSRPQTCILEELYQTLALGDDACHVKSILCEDNTQTSYTEADKILMRVAYDPRLRVGMDRATALPIVRTILEELLAE